MSSTARRAFLKGAGAALSIGGAMVPAGVDAASRLAIHTTDSEPQLEALFARYTEAVAAAEAATDRAESITEAVKYPNAPAAALCRAGDEALGLTFRDDDDFAIGDRYFETPQLRRWAALRSFYHEGEAGRFRADRAHEILDNIEVHRRVCEAARESAGANTAERLAAEAWGVAHDVGRALAEAQAATLRGVLLKARAIAIQEHGDEGLNDWRGDTVANCRDPSTALAVSLTLDMIRLAGFSPDA